MRNKRENKRKSLGLAAFLLPVAALAVSTWMVPAFAARVSGDSAQSSWLDKFTPAGVDSRLAASAHSASFVSQDGRFPFTPAGVDRQQGRTMTVAARINTDLGANAVAMHDVARAAADPAANLSDRLHPSDFRLTASRGWKSFSAASGSVPALSPRAPLSELAAKSGFVLEEKSKPSRFSTDVKLDAAQDITPSPRGNAASGDYKLDVGGSYSVARGVALTAGVRYKSERDRLVSPANKAVDNEAVYIGTKIHF